MKREEIDESLKWSIGDIYANKEAFDKDFSFVKEKVSNVEKYKDTFLNDSDSFLEFMKYTEEIDRKLEKMYTYSHLSVDTEPESQEKQEMYAKIAGLIEEYENKTVFVQILMMKESDKVLEFVKEDKLKDYEVMCKRMVRMKSHMSSDEVEEVVALAGGALDASYKTYSNIRPSFKPVIVNGKEEYLNEETARVFFKNDDENIRKQAYENLNIEYQKQENVYASTLEGNLKKDVFYAKFRKFKDPLEAATFSDEVTEDLFYMILNSANKKYHSYYVDFLDIEAKILNKEKLDSYDLRYPVVKNIEKKITIEDAWNLIFEVTKCYGPEYREILEKAKNERWIDYMPHSGKRHGAYSSGCYDTKPYILMSFTEDIDSVFTMIHELGHSVHSYLARHTQNYVNSEYKIFVAEVASTTNEMLLMNYLIKNAVTDEEKKYFLYKKIDEFIGTCYRQPFFADFEDRLHKKIENNEGLSSGAITDLYEKMSEEYYGGKVNQHKLAKYSCYAVPHFYYNYYVYKYTIGMCVANVIAKRLGEGDTEQLKRYFEFLKLGCSKNPVDSLIVAGVNPLDESLYEESFNNFKNDVEEFRKVLKLS